MFGGSGQPLRAAGGRWGCPAWPLVSGLELSAAKRLCATRDFARRWSTRVLRAAVRRTGPVGSPYLVALRELLNHRTRTLREPYASSVLVRGALESPRRRADGSAAAPDSSDPPVASRSQRARDSTPPPLRAAAAKEPLYAPFPPTGGATPSAHNPFQ